MSFARSISGPGCSVIPNLHYDGFTITDYFAARLCYRLAAIPQPNTSAEGRRVSAPTESVPAAAPARTKAQTASRLASIFSFPGMCMFLLAAVIFGFCVKQFAEPDIWWHLRTAQDLIQTHDFAPPDTYSFTAAGTIRPNYEWLSEIAYFAAFKAGGLRGILALYFVVLVLTFAGVYYLSSSAADPKNAVIATLIGVFLGTVSIGPRTLLFGWLCMTGLLLVLDRFRRTGKGLWLLPPLFALWINLHPSWIFGFAVLGLTIASGLVEGEWALVEARRWSRPELTKLSFATLGSVVALFVNPLGYKLVLYPFDFLFRQQGNVAYVQEWQGVDFSTGNGKLTLFVILGLLAAAMFSRRRWRLDEVLVTAFALWAGLSHARFLFFFGLVVPLVLAPRLNLFPPYEPEADKPLLNGGIMVAILAAIIWFYPSNLALQHQVDEEYPTAALQFMRSHQLQGNIFNQYVWGGYMEWNAPELKPFADGRADIFVYKGVLDDHRKATSMQEPLEVMEKYNIRYALLQPNPPLTYLLENSAGWHTLYSDKIAVLLERIPATELPAR